MTLSSKPFLKHVVIISSMMIHRQRPFGSSPKLQCHSSKTLKTLAGLLHSFRGNPSAHLRL